MELKPLFGIQACMVGVRTERNLWSQEKFKDTPSGGSRRPLFWVLSQTYLDGKSFAVRHVVESDSFGSIQQQTNSKKKRDYCVVPKVKIANPERPDITTKKKRNTPSAHCQVVVLGQRPKTIPDVNSSNEQRPNSDPRDFWIMESRDSTYFIVKRGFLYYFQVRVIGFHGQCQCPHKAKKKRALHTELCILLTHCHIIIIIGNHTGTPNCNQYHIKLEEAAWKTTTISHSFRGH